MARWPKYQPTDAQRRQVMTMAGFGITQDEISRLMEISDRTLRTHYKQELATGATEANLRVAQSLYTNATKYNNVVAQIWWTKARMGWRQPPADVNIGGQAGNPLGFEIVWGPAREPQTLVIEANAEESAADVAEAEVIWGSATDAPSD